MLFFTLTAQASAQGLAGYNRVYHHPALTIVVLHASGDADMQISMVPLREAPYTTLPQKETRLWETYFRLFRHRVEGQKSWFGNRIDFKDAVIQISDRGKNYSFPVPYEQMKEESRQNDFMIIDLEKESITVGKPFSRTAAFFLFHLFLYIVTGSLLLYYYGVRELRSWSIYLIYTILTKIIVCYLTISWLDVDPKLYIVYAAGALLYVVLDIAFYLLKMDWEDKDTVSKFSALSNVLSALLLFAALHWLPT